MEKLSFLFLGANSPWTYGLAEALAQQYPIHAVQFYDWRTYNLLRPNWPGRGCPPLLQRSFHVLPTGYAGRLGLLFRFYLQQRIDQWCQQLKQLSGADPWVIAPHPDVAPWVRKVPPERLIYYNFDDYVLYRPNREQSILEHERELVERAALILCASQWQFSKLQTQYPHQASRMYHYPHGCVDAYLNPDPHAAPESKTVNFVGSLGDRLDWPLIHDVIKTCLDVTFIFVGSRDDQGTLSKDHWQAAREKVLALPNVRYVGRVPSEQVATYYWSAAINWIPYTVNHPFNQASCPTKIMDGIASGRPVLSTGLPECHLYPDWITCFQTPEEASTFIHQEFTQSDQGNNSSKSLMQVNFARQNTWQSRVTTLRKLLLIT
jgi:teichuronic acid biosynthesis glycosyltransferase TuaH